MNDENPYAPPQASLDRPLGIDRYYGILIGGVKFSVVRKLTRNPLTWIRVAILKWTGRSRAVVNSGIINPNSPTELQVADLPAHVRERLATKHTLLSELGFRWVGYYRSPAFGAGQMVGELWVDDQNAACLNLLLQTLAYPRATVIAEHFTLFSPSVDQTMLYTSTYPIELVKVPGQETLRLTDAKPDDVIRRHRERLKSDPAQRLPSADWLTADRVWNCLFGNIRAEIRALEAAQVICSLTESQARKLDRLSVCFDFRERTVPWPVRLVASRSFSFYAYVLGVVSLFLRWPNARALMFGGLIWFCLTLLFSNSLIYRYLRAKPADQLPPRVF